MLNITQLGHFAAMIRAEETTHINSLNCEAIKAELAHYGVLLFRGFDANVQDYSAFTHSLCKRVTIDPARQFVSNQTQLVDSGLDAIPLHCENGLTPFIPDVLLFMCEVPAERGSATTYCDGEHVWNHLSPQAKEYFTQHRFYFSRIIPHELWTKYIANEFGIADLSSINESLFRKISATLPQHHFELQEDGDLLANLNVKLVHSSFFSDTLTFANSLIGPSYNYQKPIVKDEEGNTIPPSFIDEFERISAQFTEEVLWEKHDILVIDNTRYMHGRRKIEDVNRKIYASMGYLV